MMMATRVTPALSGRMPLAVVNTELRSRSIPSDVAVPEFR